MKTNLADFTFCILTYNHSEFILEHLESIKYQVINYGQNIDCHIIINDDSSTDDTVNIIEYWLSCNSYLFFKIKKIFNALNIGTCQSFVNICKNINTEYCKITAGDDVYTFHNIFEFVSIHSEYSMLSGAPIHLYNENLKINCFENFNYHASDIIYKNSKLINRLSNVNVINAPNLFYSTNYLKNNNILIFLKNFSVVEDWPLQVAIAENDSNSNIISENIPIVFYRRTSNSTYIISTTKFIKDKLKIFDYLIDLQYRNHKYFLVFMLKNRKYLLTKSSAIRYLFNLSVLFYLLRIIKNLPCIYKKYKSVSIDLKIYQGYYNEIKKSANWYKRSIDSSKNIRTIA